MLNKRSLVPFVTLALALPVLTSCGDSDPDDDPNDAPVTFEEPLVASSAIEGLGILHSRPEQEVFYEDGVFAENHPIALIVQMAWDADGFDHPIFVGLVNRDRTAACILGSRNVAYGGPGTVEEDEEARRFVIQTYVPDHCGPDDLGEGPYDVWVGANRYVAANPAIGENDDEAPNDSAFAFLSEGNVVIFGEDGATDLTGAGRGDSCGKLVAGVGAFERTTDRCGDAISVIDSPGSNILIDKMVLDSSVAVLTTSEVGGNVICVQDKGRALIEGRLDLALYGQLPSSFELDDVDNDLASPVRIVQRLCPDDSGDPGDTRCDRNEAQWINMLVNPQAQSERAGWNDGTVQDRFPGAPMGPPPVGPDELEAGGFDNLVDDMAYLDIRQVPQQLLLPKRACDEVRNALSADRTGFVLESCVVADGDVAEQDAAFGGGQDNCIRQTLEVAEQQINTDVDPDGPPPPPPGPRPGSPIANGDGHSGGWLSVFNSSSSFSKSYGDDDWTELEFGAGYTVAGGTDGAYAGAYFAAELDGEFSFDLAGLEIYADAHDSSNADGSEAVFEATVLGVSEGVGAATESAFELRVSAFGTSYEKCVDEKIGWWVISITVEGCASFTADVGGTLIGEFYLTNGSGNLEAVVGVVDVGPLVEAFMDGSVQVGDGCCSISLSGELDPLASLSIGNDYYLIGEVATNGSLVGITISTALVDMNLELIDGKVKLKVKFLGTTKSTKLINKDGWTWDASLLSFSITF